MFRKLHSSFLVYNTCWEDPRCDRDLLKIDSESEVVMIASAGCNVFDYLLDWPKSIHAVDINPGQTALLWLKLAMFKRINPDLLHSLFLRGRTRNIRRKYHEEIRPFLNDEAKSFWDKNHVMFRKRGLRRSFYHRGTFGTLAWFASRYLHLKRNLNKQVQVLFSSETIEAQVHAFDLIENKFRDRFLAWMMGRPYALALIGAPQDQLRYQNKLEYIQNSMRKVFRSTPLQDNYFWRVYYHGSYSENCCPSYLKPEYFDDLAEQVEKVHVRTTSISAFLRDNPKVYSHYVLLDHQDWMAKHDRMALEEEWKLILKNSKPGTRVLMRSSAKGLHFLPTFVKDHLVFDHKITRGILRQDRVGTHSSIHLGIVTRPYTSHTLLKSTL